MEDFQVTEPIVIGDLSEVKEQKSVMPPASNVRVAIRKASIKGNGKDGNSDTVKWLNLELRITEGIPVTLEDGSLEMKYKNKPLFTGMMDLPFWADLTVKTSKWWQTKQYLINFKKFCVALDIDLKSVTVDDMFLEVLLDRELLIDVRHEENRSKNESGEYVGDGTYREKIANFKKAE